MADSRVIAAAGDVVRALDAAGFDYALGGAVALAYWGVPRATVDVDVGVAAEPMQLPELFAVLLKLLYGRTKDLADLERLFALHPERLDRAYLDRWVGQLFTAGDPRRLAYESLLARSGLA